MSLIPLSEQDEYGLTHSEQDCRGWQVSDAAGTVLGTCTDMIVDTEAEHVDSIVLDSGARIAAADITLQHGTVVVRAGTTPAAASESVREAVAPAVTQGVDEGLTLPVIEERIKIGKRDVSSGGVRVTQRVTDRPVEETVTLRDERVFVERRAVNAVVTNVPADAFKDGVLEITETDEEAVVAKQARVVEEVVVTKDVTEREETVRDTVKRTDVVVEPLAADTDRSTNQPSSTDKTRDR